MQKSWRPASREEIAAVMDRAAFDVLLANPEQYVTMAGEVMHHGGSGKDTRRRAVAAEMLMRAIWPLEDGTQLVMRPDLLIETARHLDSSGQLCARVQAMAIDRASESALRIVAKHPDVIISMNVCGNDLLRHRELQRSVACAVSVIREASRHSNPRFESHQRPAARAPERPPSRARVVIELSEHHLGINADGDVHAVVGVTRWLRRIGAGVWFDDLSDGEASLSTLQTIDEKGGVVNGIKLSRAQTLKFLEGDENAKSLVSDAHAFSAKYGATLVFEGVELPEQLADALAENGVDPGNCLMQGHGRGAWVTSPSRGHADPVSLGVPLARSVPAPARITTMTAFR